MNVHSFHEGNEQRASERRKEEEKDTRYRHKTERGQGIQRRDGEDALMFGECEHERRKKREEEEEEEEETRCERVLFSSLSFTQRFSECVRQYVREDTKKIQMTRGSLRVRKKKRKKREARRGEKKEE